MIYIINSNNRHAYLSVLDDMHKMRYRCAVEQWGWELECPRAGYDEDEFDGPSTVYFIKINSSHSVVACARLNPTNHPHMMTEIFSDYCNAGPIPQAEDIYELSRLSVDKTFLNKKELVLTTYELLAAICEFSIKCGIREITWLTYSTIYNASLEVWETKPIGLPKKHEKDGTIYIAAKASMDEIALAHTKEKARIEGHVTEYLTPLNSVNPIPRDMLLPETYRTRVH